MRQLEPQGLGQRALSALALLVAMAYGAKLITTWLMPLVPVAMSALVVVGVFTLVFRRRR